MSDERFLEDEVFYEDEVSPKRSILSSPIYQREKDWVELPITNKVLEIITNPFIIAATIIVCASGILILGGYQ